MVNVFRYEDYRQRFSTARYLTCSRSFPAVPETGAGVLAPGVHERTASLASSTATPRGLQSLHGVLVRRGQD
jgi:hypothetical protein